MTVTVVEFTECFASEEACMVYLMTINLRYINISPDNKNKVHTIAHIG